MADPVLDIKGDPVLPGMPYYVTVAKTQMKMLYKPEDSPLNVYLPGGESGQPVMLFPVSGGNTAAVTVKTPVYVMFAVPSFSFYSTLWKFKEDTSLVTTGGSAPTPPQPQDTSSFFSVNGKRQDGYALFSNLNIPSPTRLEIIGSENLLGVGGKQLLVQFTRVPDPTGV